MTFNLSQLKMTEDFLLIQESCELECKEATGKDGKGKLPKDFWKTYSAFANSSGGIVLLGVKEKNQIFSITGIQSPQSVIDDLFNTLNSETKCNVNLLTDELVNTITIEGKSIIAIEVPQASRHHRPVFINNNPMTGTFVRQHTGDYQAGRELVQRMISEQEDAKVLTEFTLDDLDSETIRTYRQMFQNRNPDHPYNGYDDLQFLKSIQAWKKDRATQSEGPTIAGLLMFGKFQSIQDVYPHYMLDYQEKEQAKKEVRWVDRITLDGTWSGNLFDFYRKVSAKLYQDLKTPFQLDGDTRTDQSMVHTALREAIVNTLVHADYADRASVYIVKRPDMFGFRNPGKMRIPPDIAIQGGDSDCRNRLLHPMFRLVGLGEQAGSGLPKIFKGWDSQHWRMPSLYDRDEPFYQTLLKLRMIDLIPEEVRQELLDLFGESFHQLSRLEVIILVLAKTENSVNHARVLEVTQEHTHDISQSFKKLVAEEFLDSHGVGRGTNYCLAGEEWVRAEDVFGRSEGPASSGHKSSGHKSSGHKGDLAVENEDILGENGDFTSKSSILAESSSGHKSSGHTGLSSGHRNNLGRLIHEKLEVPIVDDVSLLVQELTNDYLIAANEAQESKRLEPQVIEGIILELCSECYFTSSALAQLLNRNSENIRKRYLSPMVDKGLLVLAFPQTPTHELQAYRVPQPERVD